MIRCVLILAMLVSVAHAEDIVAYQAEGDAPATAADARVMALDEAFAQAVQTALGELVAGDVRTARKDELDREIVGRARLWVAKFGVTRDETADGRRQLTVSVKVDRDKLRARLAELGIAAREVAPEQSAARTATILLRITLPDGVRADYGPNADPDLSGVSALTTLLRNAGFAVRRAPDSGPPPRGDGALPLGDGEADALAAAAKAEVVAIAGVTVGPSTPVRGLPTSASLVTANVRVVDRKAHQVIGQGTGIAAARGDDRGYAVDRALVGAAVDALPPEPPTLSGPGAFRGDDTPVAEPGIVLVRLPASTPYGMVLTEQKYLAGAKGVRSATLRRLSPAGWVIGVETSEPVEQIARIARRAPATDTAVSVKIVGAIIELALSGAP